MKNYRAIADTYRDDLQSYYNQDESRQLFLLAFSHITGMKSAQFGLMQQSTPNSAMTEQFLSILAELATGRPIQHILGKADFYGESFYVNAHTLIPRPETEELVDLIIRNHPDSGLRVLDVGTGSGCIAISLAKHLSGARVSAIDISADAVAVARRNADHLEVDVQFVIADILEWDLILQADQQFDIIVSNPPYITPKEQAEMHPNVLRHEPHTALFVEEHNPLLFYNAIADLAKVHLAVGGVLYFEINQYLGPETVDLLQKKGFTSVELLQDINGADRMIRASIKN
ncbi:peptide chain release factor N(5)-glutamine methyltransferase [Sphingobacterium psychroaquaticum]|uniref:peptide chain release factor N(5)-glutamine methyltransferase n=1 Tax=Sphingobacterium psychroaquaticum TaxID=561061 RepID=UPI00106BE428|nr:peptide chain release factor N(5)-glutamine methyltransferase [Sphingobacterium psychroaquaticum]QBQ41618.1 peptide chain release factor N(5)-glutamine methyltransferase [Sphingobacterium psychroaquaticum]